ncbi:MAG: enoyl-CoA hydratase/isomerase family protein [Pseudomonadota bacterium]
MLETRLEDQILIVTLTHGKTNSITRQTLEMLQQAVSTAASDDAVKGIILTGQGRFFSSGFDLYTFMGFKDLAEAVAFLSYADQVLLDLFLFPKPVVCAMNGHAAAGGLILAMASDYRIITDHPKIKVGMSEIKIGVPLSVAQSAVMRFGLDSDKKFRDVMYFGDMITVSTALDKGMVDELVQPDSLIPRAKAIVSQWIDTPARPFIKLKYELKKPVGDAIRQRMADTDWHEALGCFSRKEVKNTLAFVQSTME